jgi:creatinine amidohydrolase
MLAIAPDRVHLDRAVPGDMRPLDELLPLLRAHGVRPVSANGVLGDPTGASPDEGERLLAHAAQRLLATLSLPHLPARPEVSPSSRPPVTDGGLEALGARS